MQLCAIHATTMLTWGTALEAGRWGKRHTKRRHKLSSNARPARRHRHLQDPVNGSLPAPLQPAWRPSPGFVYAFVGWRLENRPNQAWNHVNKITQSQTWEFSEKRNSAFCTLQRRNLKNGQQMIENANRTKGELHGLVMKFRTHTGCENRNSSQGIEVHILHRGIGSVVCNVMPILCLQEYFKIFNRLFQNEILVRVTH